jgi:hypothetical protein
MTLKEALGDIADLFGFPQKKDRAVDIGVNPAKVVENLIKLTDAGQLRWHFETYEELEGWCTQNESMWIWLTPKTKFRPMSLKIRTTTITQDQFLTSALHAAIIRQRDGKNTKSDSAELESVRRDAKQLENM